MGRGRESSKDKGKGKGKQRDPSRPPSNDPGWKHATLIDREKGYIKCNWCNRILEGGGIFRLKQHLAHVRGNVSPCHEVPTIIRLEMGAILEGRKEESFRKKEREKMIHEEIMGVRPGINITEGGRQRQGKINLFYIYAVFFSQLYGCAESESSEESGDEEDDIREYKRAVKASNRSFIEDDIRQRMRESAAAVGASGSGTATVRRSQSMKTMQTSIDPFLLSKQSSKQPKIKTALKGIKDAARHMGKAISRFYYYNAIPFHTADTPYFKTMVTAIQDAGQGVAPPSAYQISNTYLDETLQEMKAYADDFSRFWVETGCTIMCDGWTTKNRRKLINFLAYCPQGTVFLTSIDATDQYKSAEYLCGLMEKMVNFIGEHHVVQVVSDNEASYKAAGRLLMEKKRQLFWTPCAAHCIDLMLEDMSEDDDIKAVVAVCQKVVGFIYNHGWCLSLMRQETGGRELMRPGITRFATNFLALQSIYVNQDALKRMCTSVDWKTNFDKLNKKDKELAESTHQTLLSRSYWSRVSSCVMVFEPLVKLLRMVDSDDKAEMGFLYEAVDRAKLEIRKNIGRARSKKWWKIIDKRWDKTLHRDIHAAGYFFNPRFIYSPNAKVDDEVAFGLRRVIARLEPNIELQIRADTESERYRMRMGEFNTAKVMQAIGKLTPAEWWRLYGMRECPTLAPLAIRILSQTVSSSACERNWTTFSLIHTRPRNRLSMQKIERLVFIHYNMRLQERHLRRSQRDDHQMIDLDFIFDEEDPLLPWIQEQEDALLDDRDNEWLDEALAESDSRDNAEADPQEQERNSNGSSSDSGPSSRGHPTEHEHGATSSGHDAPSFDPGIDTRREEETIGQDPHISGFERQYSRRREHTDYPANQDMFVSIAEGPQLPYMGGPPIAGVSGGSTPVGYYFVPPREHHQRSVVPYEYAESSASSYNPMPVDIEGTSSYSGTTGHDTYASAEPPQTSPLDLLMASFFGGTDISHLYPPYYSSRRDDNDDDDEGSYYDAPRHSTWN